ncbi:MAG: HAD-IB family phosphatase [Elusimicrobia bacterium]|nr:HAD-IB family phosphatase [Elusimicrobiota bacterium]
MNGILVSDFDGTMTLYDFYDLVCRAFPAISVPGYWQKYEEGHITHFEALRVIFATIRTDEPRLLHIVDGMQIDPQLASSVALLERSGWTTRVASAGCDWYINYLLQKSGVVLPVYANPGVFSPDNGLMMSLPLKSPYCSPEFGINKMAVVKDALKQSNRVAFAGDGRPDLAPALLVEPRRRFAKHWLAKKLQEIGEPYQPFETWSDVANALAKEPALC